MSGKISTQTVADVVINDGMGYAIRHGISANAIEDSDLAEQWRIADSAMTKIERILLERTDYE
ncbi:hypothetical protein [Paenibacillus sp. NPDC057967]|uniref:hypothetical protein n=1 Tax=Paenibacillus sp. NPDC057967 TaxID=3346293 RepID=UPI0036DB0107